MDLTLGSKITLPPIPQLLGEENLQEWKNLLLQTLEFHGLSDYILKDGIEKTAQLKAYTFILILQSITHVRDRLATSGWDFNTNGQDPKDLYDLILRTISNTGAAVGELIREFVRIKISNYTSLKAFQTRAQYLKRHIGEADARCAIPDHLAVWIILNALKDNYEQWHRFLLREMTDGTLTWNKLMEEMSTESANEALNGRHLMTYINKDGYDGEVHVRCGRKHTGGDVKCHNLHPEQFAEWKRKKDALEEQDRPRQGAGSGATKFQSGIHGSMLFKSGIH